MTRVLADSTLEIIDRSWAAFLGCDRSALRPTRAVALPHATAGGYAGALAIELGAAPLVALPAALLPSLAPRVADWTRETVCEAVRAADAAHTAFGALARKIIGPAYLGYADAGTLQTAPIPPDAVVRTLAPSDAPAVAALRRACSPVEWEHGGRELASDPAVGTFVGGELASLAAYEVSREGIADIAIITHPARRRRGHARAAVAAIARQALDRGLVPRYRTLDSNRPSRAVADSLGFVRAGTSVAVRFEDGDWGLGTRR